MKGRNAWETDHPPRLTRRRNPSEAQFSDLNAMIYCTAVVPDGLIVSMHCTLVYKSRRRLRISVPRRRPGPPATRPRETQRRRWNDKPVQECCSGFSDTSLSLSAIRPSSGSERVFIFRIALLLWTFTVASAMPISQAICLLRRPRAT
jgi:hypothetical protein